MTTIPHSVRHEAVGTAEYDPTGALPSSGSHLQPDLGLPQSIVGIDRSRSTSSTRVANDISMSRSGTLKKKASLRKRNSLSHKTSKKSLRATRSTSLDGDESHSVFYTPVPTTGSPTEVLAERFSEWRKLLKDLILYFREVQSSYEHRSKALLKISNIINNTTTPPAFLTQGGVDDALHILRNYHKQAVAESSKAKDVENDVISQLSGLRSDLNQKIKEIKSLSGDFKNSVDREKEGTRKAVDNLQNALDVSDANPSSSSVGKGDPFVVRLAVDRQVEKQIEEENYLHRAYLNLEGSGRELESIVVGEIQKAYTAFANILTHEAESANAAAQELRAGPLQMPKDHEWSEFVENNSHFVNPNLPLRRVEEIQYPNRNNPAASEIRAGMLERKSKYLKSYTPGWYVLSATHLHEFKSADHIHTQQPVMSLFLLDQKLGSHSQTEASSNKFSLKGSQTGGLHRGHSWVFRAESYDTMLAWYDDIKILTEKTGPERSAFVRKHARSNSAGSQSAPSMSSDGIAEDEADLAPYAAIRAPEKEVVQAPPKRPEPGGRFPSDMNIQRHIGLQAPPSPSSGSSHDQNDPIASALSPTLVGAAAIPAAKPMHNDTIDKSYAKEPTEPVSAHPASTPPIVAAVNDQRAIQDESQGLPVRAGAYDATSMPPSDSVAPAASHVAVGTLAAGNLETQAARHHEDAATASIPSNTQPSSTVIPVSTVPTQDVSEKSASSDSTVPATLSEPSQYNVDPTEPSSRRLHPTGALFPTVVRHDTSMTVSDLHIPGEFPAVGRGGSVG